MPKTSPSLCSFSGVDALAPALRSYVVQAQDAGIERHGTFKVAVSGGSLPKTLATALLAPEGEGKIEFAKWEVFFADERCVPLNHEDSNYKLLKDELLDKIPANMGAPSVHTIEEDLLRNTQDCADGYEKSLVGSFAGRDSVRLPIFDLVLLGCGPDGHTCSLFPGHELLRETHAWVAAIEDSPKPPPKRITLTLPVVTHAVKIAFLATGDGKQEIMKKIFDTDEELPSSLVNDEGGDRVTWFVDDAAVKGVSFPKRASL